jgi:flagellar hook-associated protein 1 FlgK
MKLVQGDSFEVQPTRNVAASFDVAITDPAKIAAASPAIAQAGKTNTGGGTVAVSNVAQGFGTTLLPITATYNAATGKYALTDSTGAAVVNDSGGNPITPVVSGATTQYTIDGVTMTLGGTPKDGDTFTLSVNSGGVSSNGNALALAKLQNTKTIGGVSNYNDAYAQLVNDVGSRAKSISIASTSQDSITTQVRTAQQSVSGVNMDEETVSLLRYQQLYQASAKVIQTASSMFDAIIGLQ